MQATPASAVAACIGLLSGFAGRGGNDYKQAGQCTDAARPEQFPGRTDAEPVFLPLAGDAFPGAWQATAPPAYSCLRGVFRRTGFDADPRVAATVRPLPAC